MFESTGRGGGGRGEEAGMDFIKQTSKDRLFQTVGPFTLFRPGVELTVVAFTGSPERSALNC